MQNNGLVRLMVVVCLVTFGLVGCGGGSVAGPTPATADGTARDDGGSATAQDSGSVTICHIPGGNFANAHDVTVAGSAVSAHLAHGDLPLPCPQP
jgi:hypothetical protein